jgi:hypothetical protein
VSPVLAGPMRLGPRVPVQLWGVVPDPRRGVGVHYLQSGFRMTVDQSFWWKPDRPVSGVLEGSVPENPGAAPFWGKGQISAEKNRPV